MGFSCLVIIIGVIAVRVVVDKVKIRGIHLLVAWVSPGRSVPLRAFDNGTVQLAHAGFQQFPPSARIVSTGRKDGQPVQKCGDAAGLLSYRMGNFFTDDVPQRVGLTGIVLSVQPQFRIAAQECGNALVVLFGPLTQASDEGLGKAE